MMAWRRRDLLSLCLGLLGGAGAARATHAAGRTLLVYDPLFLEHRMAGHPERPERLTAILAALDALPALERVAPRPATVEELRLVHTAAHIERIQALATGGGGWVDADTYVNPRSFDAARVPRLQIGAWDPAEFERRVLALFDTGDIRKNSV